MTRNTMRAGAFVLLTCGAIATLSAQDSQSRILHFPKNRSLGRITALDAGTKREIKDFAHWIDGTWNSEAEDLGEAQGDVLIPARRIVALTVNKEAVRDLSPLLNLRNDDLYKLSLKSHPALNKCMPYITHLTGLKELNLSGTYISAAGLKLIPKLRSLECLTPPDSITDAGLRHVTGLASLKRLYLNDSNITDRGLASLSRLTLLEELCLAGKRINGSSLVHLTHLSSLNYLMLNKQSFGNTGMEHLRNIPSLKILSFRDASIGDAAVRQLSGHAGLENMSFTRTAITDQGLTYLKTMPSLKKLSIYESCGVTEHGMPHLACIHSLEHLDLPDISDQAVASIAQLKHLKHLHIFGGSNSPNTDASLRHLSKLRDLENLMIPGNKYTDAGMDDLAKLTHLKVLIISADSVTNEGLAKLKTLAALKTLQFDSKNVTISGLSHLNSMRNLSSLVLGGIKQDNSGMDISGLAKLEQLTLKLKTRQKKGDTYDGLTDEDLACLKHLKNLNWFQMAYAQHAKISNTGMSHLKDLINMERLSIGSPYLTDPSLSYLTKMTKLNNLSITGNFTDNGLNHLAGLKGLANVWINSSQDISGAARQRLQNGLPNIYSLNVR